MIELKNVDKTIKDKKVLDGINLELKEGECVHLKGYNGSGKTMLLRMLCGLIKPDGGEIICSKTYRYGIIIENPSFMINETGLYNLKYLADIRKEINEQDIINIMKEFNLYDVRNKKVKTYSLGMKQRLALCQAFMEDSDVLLLDEPFNALDDRNLKVLCEKINSARANGKIVVIAAHGLVPQECMFDREICIEEGKIN